MNKVVAAGWFTKVKSSWQQRLDSPLHAHRLIGFRVFNPTATNARSSIKYYEEMPWIVIVFVYIGPAEKRGRVLVGTSKL
jgi:hypothetical protein